MPKEKEEAPWAQGQAPGSLFIPGHAPFREAVVGSSGGESQLSEN